MVYTLGTQSSKKKRQWRYKLGFLEATKALCLTLIGKGTFKPCDQPRCWQGLAHLSVSHNTRCSLRSEWGCLTERTGCSTDFAREFLSCFKSIQSRSTSRIRSPKSIPRYRLRFQPQPRARGSEVDATRNFLGAGMCFSLLWPAFKSLFALPQRVGPMWCSCW